MKALPNKPKGLWMLALPFQVAAIATALVAMGFTKLFVWTSDGMDRWAWHEWAERKDLRYFLPLASTVKWPV